MQRHLLLGFTNPVPGREAEFDAWYDEVHIPDVLAIPEFVSAQRYRRSVPLLEFPNARCEHLVSYEIVTDDLAGLFERVRTDYEPRFTPSTAADMSQAEAYVFRAVGPRRTSDVD